MSASAQIDSEQMKDMTTTSIQEMMGLYQKRSLQGIQKWNERVYTQVIPCDAQWSMELLSSGSILNIQTAYVEYVVNTNAATTRFYHNLLQFVQGVSIRFGPHSLKYRPGNSILAVTCAQHDYDKYSHLLHLKQDGVGNTIAGGIVADAPSVESLFINQHNQFPLATSMTVRVPLVCLFPELKIKEGMNGIYLSNESTLQMTFRVGSSGILTEGALQGTNSFQSISNFKIVYTEQYPDPQQLQKILTKTIPISIPQYEVQTILGAPSGQFNFSLSSQENYERLLITCIYPNAPVALRVNLRGLSTYAEIYGAQTAATAGFARQNNILLPIELQSIQINWPGMGQISLTRSQLMSLQCAKQNAVRCFSDNIFKFMIDIDLCALPFDEQDSAVVYGSTVSQNSQMTVNYKMMQTSTPDQHSVPVYTAASPAATAEVMANVAIQAILCGTKSLVIKNGSYRAL